MVARKKQDHARNVTSRNDTQCINMGFERKILRKIFGSVTENINGEHKWMLNLKNYTKTSTLEPSLTSNALD